MLSCASLMPSKMMLFDTVQLDQADPCAEYLGAPPRLVPLRAFYANSMRLFTCRGVCSDSWIHATRGVLRGCPLSPMLAALVMTIWSRFVCVCVNNIDAAICIDDRTFWHVGDAGPERVHELLQAH